MLLFVDVVENKFNKNVDIKLSAHDPFMEMLTLKNHEKLPSECNYIILFAFIK